jgi:periplasmic mercuric ion binding protein
MKIQKIIATIALSSLLFVACKDKTSNGSNTVTETTTPKVKKEIDKENLQTASFTIEGMTCAIGCAKTIQVELSELEGVETAAVDFEKKSATVSFDKSILTPETLTKLVQETGDGKTYTVSNLKS